MLDDKDTEVYKKLFFRPEKTKSGMIQTGMGLMPVSYTEIFNQISACVRILYAKKHPEVYVTRQIYDKKIRRKDFVLEDGQFEKKDLDKKGTSSLERLEHIQELLIKFFEAKRKDDFLFENYDIAAIDDEFRYEISKKVATDIHQDAFCQKLSVYALQKLKKASIDLKTLSSTKSEQLERITEYLIFQHFSVKELSIIQSIKMLDSRKKEADVLEALDYYHLIRRYGKTQIGAVLAHRLKQIRNFENLEKRLLRLSAIQEKQHM